MAVTVSLPRQLGWAPDDSTEWDESPVVCALRLQIKAASASQTKEKCFCIFPSKPPDPSAPRVYMQMCDQKERLK